MREVDAVRQDRRGICNAAGKYKETGDSALIAIIDDGIMCSTRRFSMVTGTRYCRIWIKPLPAVHHPRFQLRDVP